MSEISGQIKQYRILRQLGVGGMGEVYLAEDTNLDRKVALKFLTGAASENPDHRQRFLREAKAAAALDHPFICKIYESGEVDGRAYIAMEFVEGQELRDLMDLGPLPFEQALKIVTDVTEAVAEAHAAGIVHRDLKPANIMVTKQGYVKVMDFGLAKRTMEAGVDDDTATGTLFATQAGVIMGTVPYMSPEQTRGENVGPTSDVFALGIILHEVVAGKHPFPGNSMADVITSIMRDEPPPLGERAGHLGPGLEQIAAKAMAKSSAERYPHAAAMAADLRELRSGDLKIKTPPARARDASGVTWQRLALVAGLVIVVAGGTWWLSQPAGPGGDTPVTAAPSVPLSVLIADIDNTTGDRDLDGALETTLGLGLQGITNVTLFSRSQAHDLAATLDPSGDGRLDTSLAQLVSRSEGLNMVIDGRIEPQGDGLVIRLRAVDPVTSEALAETTRELASKADFLSATEAIAGEMRTLLANLPPESLQAQSEETFTANSLPALRAYTRAQEHVHAGETTEAIADFEAAVAADPQFGRAYAGLATAYYNTGDTETAERYYQLALQNIDRMTDREKYRTRGGYYLRARDYRRAIDEYDALTREYPRDPAGPGNLAFAHFLARNMDEAVEFGKRGVEIAPDNLNARFNLAWFAMSAGDFDLAEREARNVLGTNPGFAEAHLVVGVAALGRGNPERAAQAYDQISQLGDQGASLAAIARADLASYQGRLADAVGLLRAGIAADEATGSAPAAAVKRAFLAAALLQLGDTDGALRTAREARDSSGADSVQLAAAITLARAGSGYEALSVAEGLGAKLQPEPRAYARLIEGEVALVNSSAVDAIDALSDSVDLLDTWLGRLSLGRAYIQAGAFPEAHSELETALARAGEATSVFFDDLPSYRYFPQVHYYLGRALEGMGSAAAADSYRAFLEVKTTDEDPLVVDARTRSAE